MKFGQVEDPGKINFKLPKDHPDTARVLQQSGNKNALKVYVGCAKWNKTDLKNFYPKGTKDELTYYSTQFNSIELNATFYNMPDAAQVVTWTKKVPPGFRFFPKITNSISHYKRLKEAEAVTEVYCNAVAEFGKKLGMVFLQLHDNFKPKDIDRLEDYLKKFPKGVPLGVEVRNGEWFGNKEISSRLFSSLEKFKKTNIIVDTAGRRDLLHMRLTTPYAFVRYVGANHPSDYTRLDDWLKRIKQWQQLGLKELYFFVHQNVEKESPLLSAYFIEKINKQLGLEIKVPEKSPVQILTKKKVARKKLKNQENYFSNLHCRVIFPAMQNVPFKNYRAVFYHT